MAPGRSRAAALLRQMLVYGVGDSTTAVLGLLMLPVLTRYLTPTDYGIVAMLAVVEAMARSVFRWGLDLAFIRLYVDCTTDEARQVLASTVFLFLVAANGVLTAGGVAGSAWLADHVGGIPQQQTLIAVTFFNVFVSSFFFIPYQVLRVREQSGQYVALSLLRTVGHVALRLGLVAGAHLGIVGVVAADTAITIVMTLVLVPLFVPIIRPIFSRDVLAQALRFALPRVPHNIAQQSLSLMDRYFLKAYGTLADVGLYHVGAAFGLVLKFALGTFETAWTPFFLNAMREPDAKRTYREIATPVVAVLVLLVAGVSALADDAIRLFASESFHAASRVTPWIAIAVLFQGLYLIGSIGLIITKRTAAYPVATLSAALAGIAANVLLIPRVGMMGAAWANIAAYGTLTLVATTLSWRVYPVSYDWSRLARIGIAGLLAYWAAAALLPPAASPLIGLPVRAIVTTATYLTALAAFGVVGLADWRLARQFNPFAAR